MIHLGLKDLVYAVNFDASCYYPIAYEKADTKILFGRSFGLFSSNSISVAWRPSDRLEQIDLYSSVNSNGINLLSYIGTMPTNKKYSIKIKLHPEYNMYWINIRNESSNLNHISFSSHFKFPVFRWGYTIKKNNNYKILLENI